MEAGRQALERGEFRQAVWEATSIKDPPYKKKKDIPSGVWIKPFTCSSFSERRKSEPSAREI